MKEPVLIFDFDGTIADTLEYLFVIGNDLADEFKFKHVERHQIETYKNMTLRQMVRDLGVPILKIPKILLRGKEELNNRIHEVQIIQGIAEVLLQLKKQDILLGLVSTNTLENIHTVLENHGLHNVFDFIGIGSGLLGKPRALKKIIKQYHLDKTKILYVGDEVRDIEASRRAGLSVASVTWGYNSAQSLRNHNPDYLLEHPQDLVRILAKSD